MSHQTTLKTTPFKVMYRHVLPPMISFEGATKVPAVDQQLRDRDTFLAEIRERLLQTQARIKKVHDAGHWDVEFNTSAWVWLRLNQHAMLFVHDGAPSKLVHRFFGSYQVLERVGLLAYKLQLPQKTHIHNMFHVTFLKKFVDTPPQQTLAQPPIVRGRAVPHPEKVTRARPTSSSWDMPV
jgi:hypothetical protein